MSKLFFYDTGTYTVRDSVQEIHLLFDIYSDLVVRSQYQG